MNEFPNFMKNPVNMVDPASQFTPGIEGYVYDGLDGSQMAFWTYAEDAVSKEHDHPYEEYIVVVQGQYNLYIDGNTISLRAGDEHLIPTGKPHSGKVFAGTRAIYAFGGSRAKRQNNL